MPWIIGVDEAGYGPNLGPLVMTAAACRVPPRWANVDLWDVLRAAVRRAGDPEDGRLLVADSKVVYSPARGLSALEIGALVLTSHVVADSGACLSGCLGHLCENAKETLADEAWYVGDSRLPFVATDSEVAAAVTRFRDTCERRRVGWAVVQSVIVCPREFNALLNKWESKGVVLARGLAQLVARLREAIAGDSALAFFIDKHGGRNYYAAALQDAVPDAMIVASEESAGRSSYIALGLGRDVRFTFEPRAEAAHFCVAAASMVSKYLREALMHEFNRFWRSHIPDLKPTAGYPRDAARFLKNIAPAMQRLAIDKAAVWRRK